MLKLIRVICLCMFFLIVKGTTISFAVSHGGGCQIKEEPLFALSENTVGIKETNAKTLDKIRVCINESGISKSGTSVIYSSSKNLEPLMKRKILDGIIVKTNHKEVALLYRFPGAAPKDSKLFESDKVTELRRFSLKSEPIISNKLAGFLTGSQIGTIAELEKKVLSSFKQEQSHMHLVKIKCR